MSFPMNWAPLAPGSDPVLFGKPVGDGLKVGEGIPLFSGLTGYPLQVGPVCVPIPVVWPASPLAWPAQTCPTSNYEAGWAEVGSILASG